MQKNRIIATPSTFKATLFLSLTLSIILIPQSSCTLFELMYVDCSKCYTNKPEYDIQKLYLTINDENPEVLVTVYIGPYESNNIYLTFKSREKDKMLTLRTDTQYTIKVEYKKKGRTYYVIDGCIIKARKIYDNCDEPCYYIVMKPIDLRLVF
jgi:hypothetical protein